MSLLSHVSLLNFWQCPYFLSVLAFLVSVLSQCRDCLSQSHCFPLSSCFFIAHAFAVSFAFFVFLRSQCPCFLGVLGFPRVLLSPVSLLSQYYPYFLSTPIAFSASLLSPYCCFPSTNAFPGVLLSKCPRPPASRPYFLNALPFSVSLLFFVSFVPFPSVFSSFAHECT